MDKHNFFDFYNNKIRVHFDHDRFLHDKDIQLVTHDKQLSEVLHFYTPWYHKRGELAASIEEVLKDNKYAPIQVRDIPSLEQTRFPAGDLPATLWPIPVVTDAVTGRTVVLDSNHTLAAIIHTYKDLDKTIPVIEISGKGAVSLNIDLQIIAEKSNSSPQKA